MAQIVKLLVEVGAKCPAVRPLVSKYKRIAETLAQEQKKYAQTVKYTGEASKKDVLGDAIKQNMGKQNGSLLKPVNGLSPIDASEAAKNAGRYGTDLGSGPYNIGNMPKK